MSASRSVILHFFGGLQCYEKAPISAPVQKIFLVNTAKSDFPWRGASLLLLSHSNLCDACAASCGFVLLYASVGKLVCPIPDSGIAQAE